MRKYPGAYICFLPLTFEGENTPFEDEEYQIAQARCQNVSCQCRYAWPQILPLLPHHTRQSYWGVENLKLRSHTESMANNLNTEAPIRT